MAQANDPPHQLSFHDVCTTVGRLYLETHTELERLRDILIKQQAKLTQTEQELQESQQLIAKLTHGTGT